MHNPEIGEKKAPMRTEYAFGIEGIKKDFLRGKRVKGGLSSDIEERLSFELVATTRARA